MEIPTSITRPVRHTVLSAMWLVWIVSLSWILSARNKLDCECFALLDDERRYVDSSLFYENAHKDGCRSGVAYIFVPGLKKNPC